jgi:large subunit ribosomal protein L25
MSDTLALEPRTPGKTKDAKAVRAAGKIPGVLYGRGNDPVAFQVDRPALRDALAGDSTVLTIAVPGRKGDVHAVLKDYQLDPVRDTVVHIDLLEISMTERLVANVSVRVEGDAPGVKDGGVLDQPTFQVEVEALPSDLPSELIVDVSHLNIGESVKVSDIVVPTGVTIRTDADTTIAVVATPTVMEEPEAEVEGEGEGEGEAPAEAEGGDAEE